MYKTLKWSTNHQNFGMYFIIIYNVFFILAFFFFFKKISNTTKINHRSFLGCHGNNSANNILAPPNPTKENNNSSNGSINGYGGNTNNLDSTTLNVTLGSEMKSITVPKSSTYKDMISTIKDKFGVNSKSTLCIKCENKDGEMFSLASDCHVKKAYNQQPENQPKELRLVVKGMCTFL